MLYSNNNNNNNIKGVVYVYNEVIIINQKSKNGD